MNLRQEGTADLERRPRQRQIQIKSQIQRQIQTRILFTEHAEMQDGEHGESNIKTCL